MVGNLWGTLFTINAVPLYGQLVLGARAAESNHRLGMLVPDIGELPYIYPRADAVDQFLTRAQPQNLLNARLIS